MIDIDPTTKLILQVGNVIHDDVCMALSRVNFKELEDAPHSDRVDAAAEKIIALIEQDVARRLLSDEAVEAAGKSRGGFTDLGWKVEATSDFRDELMRSSKRDMAAAISAIGITLEPEL